MLDTWKKKYMTNLDSTLKSRDITLPTKVHLVKAMVFPLVMYRCESWTIKKNESWRIDAFELWYWRRLLRVHWTARRPNKWILKGINPEYSLEGQTPILWPPVRRAYSWPHVKSWLIRKDTDARKDWRKEEKGMTENKIVGWHHWLNGNEFEQAPWDCERQGHLACCSPWGCKEADTAEQLSNKKTMTLGIYHNAQDIVGIKCKFVEWIN